MLTVLSDQWSALLWIIGMTIATIGAVKSLKLSCDTIRLKTKPASMLRRAIVAYGFMFFGLALLLLSGIRLIGRHV